MPRFIFDTKHDKSKQFWVLRKSWSITKYHETNKSQQQVYPLSINHFKKRKLGLKRNAKRKIRLGKIEKKTHPLIWQLCWFHNVHTFNRNNGVVLLYASGQQQDWLNTSHTVLYELYSCVVLFFFLFFSLLGPKGKKAHGKATHKHQQQFTRWKFGCIVIEIFEH